MCNEHGHSHGEHGESRKAEKGLLLSLAPVGVVVAIVATTCVSVLPWLHAWVTAFVPWVPSPLHVITALAAIVLARTFRGTPGHASSAKRFARSAEFMQSAAAERLLADGKAKGMAANLSRAITFKTVSYDSEEARAEHNTRDVFLALHAFLKQKYPLVHQRLERHVVNDLSLLYVWKGSEDASQLPYLVTAHLDVVPTPEAARWQHEPFSGLVKDGEVWGRGAIDLKNLVIGWMEALEDLLQQGFQPRRSIYLALGHDEEIGGWQGAKHIAEFIHQRLGPRCFEFMWDEGLFVVDRIVPGHRGPVAMICVAEKGSVTLELSVEGTPGHSSAPEFESAVGILANAVSKLERQPLPATLDGPANNMFTALRPGFTFGMKLLVSNLWLFGPLLRRVLAAKHKTSTLVRTTTALTVFQAGSKHNVVPGLAKAIVQHRVHPKDTLDDVQAYDTAVVNDRRVQVKRVGSVPVSPVSSHTHPAFRSLEEVIGLVYPQAAAAPSLFVANSDSRHYWDLARQIYRFNPILLDRDETTRFHGIDERISVRNFAQVVLFCRTFVEVTDKRDAPR